MPRSNVSVVLFSSSFVGAKHIPNRWSRRSRKRKRKKSYCYLYPKGPGGQSYWTNLWDWSGNMNGVDRCLVIMAKK